MSKRIAWMGLVLAGGLTMSVAMGDARADGALIGPASLAAADRSALLAEIQKERAAKPAAFAAVADLRGKLAELDAQKRGRMVPVTPVLKAMGPDALMPMLEQIAVASPPRGGLPDAAWLAWRVGLVEAVGMLRDPRSGPVLLALLDGPETDFDVVRAVAGAYGKLATDASAKKLIAMSKAPGSKQKAVLAGMGHCRRAAVAQALADAVAAKPDADTARHVMRALGDVGSSWAWQTPIVQQSGEEAATRAAAAKALVQGFVAYADPAVRKMASHSLMVVDHPSTPSLIAAAKLGAGPELSAALDELAQRFAKNPVH